MEKKKEKVEGFYATVRKDGRVTLPKDYREALGLKTGDRIQIIELRKIEPGEVE